MVSLAVCDIYPYQQEQMPMEETGNMVKLCTTVQWNYYMYVAMCIAVSYVNSFLLLQLILLAYVALRYEDKTFLDPYWLVCSFCYSCMYTAMLFSYFCVLIIIIGLSWRFGGII